MKLWAFQGRYAGLVSLGKTIGILPLIINLAAAFVLERYRVARVAIDTEELEREVRQLRKSALDGSVCRRERSWQPNT